MENYSVQLDKVRRSRNRSLAIFLFLIVALLFETNYIIDINQKLDETLQKLSHSHSEDVSLLENSRVIIGDVLQENETVAIDKREKITAKKEDIESSKESSKDVQFLQLKPSISMEKLKSKYTPKITKVSSGISINDKKSNFIQLMLPIIEQSRKELQRLHQKVEGFRGRELSIHEENFLNSLFDEYRISNREIESLLTAIKPHPTSLVLAQAAMESGWGTSRFFMNGNNIFGIWSFDDRDERIEAKSRSGVFLKKYDSLKESVDDYFLTLGRVPLYRELRELRKSSRDPLILADKLSSYSESSNYSENLKIIIRVNKFQKYD